MSNDLRDFYKERKNEVDQYFNFLEALNIDQNSQFNILLNQGTETSNTFALSDTQVMIFKGNCFLMLYNVIEGTINKSLEYIFDAINDKGIQYCELTQTIKSIWLKSEIKQDMKDDMTKLSDFIDQAPEQVFTLNLETFTKSHRSFFLSGNIDAKAIRENLAPKLGIIFNETEQKLLEIKDWRNKLAHGEQSFVEIAKEKSYSDILPYKEKAFGYLEKYLLTIETYVDGELYKKNTI